MNDLEHDLAARLHTLADDLAGPAPAVSAPAAIARYRSRRRTRATLVAVAAAVVAIAVGVPTAIGSLASAPDRDPAAPSISTTTAPPTGNGDNPQAIADAEDRAAQWSAAAAAAQTAAQPELEAVRDQLPTDLTLTSPADWDQWLPEGKPFPGPSLEEEISTCPVLSDRLGAALGQEMSYWTGTLPGPGGCTWVPVPLQYGPDPYDYAYVLNVNFVGDGTTIQALAQNGFLDGVPGGQVLPCPRLPVGDGLLVRCAGSLANTGSTWTLALPDARGAGIWLLTADARLDARHTSAEALVALADGVVTNYG